MRFDVQSTFSLLQCFFLLPTAFVLCLNSSLIPFFGSAVALLLMYPTLEFSIQSWPDSRTNSFDFPLLLDLYPFFREDLRLVSIFSGGMVSFSTA